MKQPGAVNALYAQWGVAILLYPRWETFPVVRRDKLTSFFYSDVGIQFLIRCESFTLLDTDRQVVREKAKSQFSHATTRLVEGGLALRAGRGFLELTARGKKLAENNQNDPLLLRRAVSLPNSARSVRSHVNRLIGEIAKFEKICPGIAKDALSRYGIEIFESSCPNSRKMIQVQVEPSLNWLNPPKEAR